MEAISSNNIEDFIKYLYLKELGQQASSEVLNSWSGLSDAEVQQYLNALFENWNYGIAERQQIINDFLEQKNISIAATPVAAESLSRTPEVVSDKQTADYPSMPKKKSSLGKWLLALLILIILCAGYAVYKFQQFQSMNYVFVTTDNVTIRNYQGDAIGRMDIYPKSGSVSYLRAADKNTYNITVGDKVYPYRRVVVDSTTFSDYLFNRKGAFGYVNENYLIDNKDNFLIYRNVFKIINTVKNENATLTSPFRKVIIGSIKNSPLRNLYILNPCNNNNPAYAAIIKQTLKNDWYEVVAKLSDGGYYIFYGNPKTEEYEAPKMLRIKDANSNNFTNLTDYNFLFKPVNGYFYLYNCDGTDADYFTHLDNDKKIQYIQSSFEPIQ